MRVDSPGETAGAVDLTSDDGTLGCRIAAHVRGRAVVAVVAGTSSGGVWRTRVAGHPVVVALRLSPAGARRRASRWRSSRSRLPAASCRTCCTSKRALLAAALATARDDATLALAIGGITGSFLFIGIGTPIADTLNGILGRRVESDLQRSLIVASLLPRTIDHLETQQFRRARPWFATGEQPLPADVGRRGPWARDHGHGLGIGVGDLPHPVRLVGTADRDGRLAHDRSGEPGWWTGAGAGQRRGAAPARHVLPRPGVRAVECARVADLRPGWLASGAFGAAVAAGHGANLVGACGDAAAGTHRRRGPRCRLFHACSSGRSCRRRSRERSISPTRPCMSRPAAASPSSGCRGPSSR